MKQVEGDVADSHTRTTRLPTYTSCTVASTLPPCSPGLICAASELHGRDTDYERRRAGGALLLASKVWSFGGVFPGGLGAVRLGHQDPGYEQEWPERLLADKV